MKLDDIINTGDPREIKRAVAVKMSIAGYSRADIAEILSITPEFVSKRKAVYIYKGTESPLLSYYELLHEAGPSREKTEKSNPEKDESVVSAKREEIKKNYRRKRMT